MQQILYSATRSHWAHLAKVCQHIQHRCENAKRWMTPNENETFLLKANEKLRSLPLVFAAIPTRNSKQINKKLQPNSNIGWCDVSRITNRNTLLALNHVRFVAQRLLVQIWWFHVSFQISKTGSYGHPVWNLVPGPLWSLRVGSCMASQHCVLSPHGLSASRLPIKGSRLNWCIRFTRMSTARCRRRKFPF